MTLAVLGPDGSPVWHGLWVDGQGAHWIGPDLPETPAPDGARLVAPSQRLIDLVQAAYRSYLERLEGLSARVDVLEGRAEPAPLGELASMLRSIAGVRRHVQRLTVLFADLDGPLGAPFPGLGSELGIGRSAVAHLEDLSAGLAQSARDLVAIRNAIEANRLAEATNRLGETSNRIAALANTSNLRMLGVAYIALLLGLISAVVLIPNTAATILGIPGAAWVPGVWIVVILVVLSVVPIAIVFSRPWVLATLRGMPSSETRTAEGVQDLPEVPAQDVDRDASLIRQGP